MVVWKEGTFVNTLTDHSSQMRILLILFKYLCHLRTRHQLLRGLFHQFFLELVNVGSHSSFTVRENQISIRR